MDLEAAGTMLKHKEFCVCGCTMYGTPRARAWSDGLGPHVRSCPCERCMAPRYKQRASRRERKVAKAVGGTRNLGSGAFGGTDVAGGICEIEETAQESVVRGVRRWWGNAAVTKKTARLLEHRLKPRALVCSWDGKPRLVVMPWDDFRQLAALAVEQEAS